MTENQSTLVPPASQESASDSDEVQAAWRRVVRRRAFLKGLGAVGATGAALPVGVLTATNALAASQLSKGDAAVLRFLAAAEILESDLWTQYAELGGATGVNDGAPNPNTGNPAFLAALQKIDNDMPQYIVDNTDDELSHAAFLNAYLKAHGAKQVNLDKFRTLPGSSATGSSGKKRLTNLTTLTVDTSYYTRYRSEENPDFGDSLGQIVSIVKRPSIPVSDADDSPGNHIQAIANTAAFHFAMIEQGGSSLYPTMALKVTNLEVLRIVLSIGGTEIDHFSLWHDKLGATLMSPLAVTDGTLSFPDLGSSTDPLKQINKILPEPCDFISESLPVCSIIRPTSVKHSGAMAAVKGLTASRLFEGQSDEFFDTLHQLAEAADEAERGDV